MNKINEQADTETDLREKSAKAVSENEEIIPISPEMIEAAAIFLLESGELSEGVTIVNGGVRLLAENCLRAGLSEARPSKTAG